MVARMPVRSDTVVRGLMIANRVQGSPRCVVGVTKAYPWSSSRCVQAV